MENSKNKTKQRRKDKQKQLKPNKVQSLLSGAEHSKENVNPSKQITETLPDLTFYIKLKLLHVALGERIESKNKIPKQILKNINNVN